MRYERFTPTPSLSDYVDHFWLIEAELGANRREEILVPNGRPTLLLSLGDEGWRKDPVNGQEWPNCSGLTGMATRPVVIGQHGQVRLVAAQLSPFGPAALGLPFSIDQHAALEEVLGAADAARLLGEALQTGVTRQTVSSLEQILLVRLKPLPPRAIGDLQQVYQALEIDLPGDVRLWASSAGISYDQLYRLFRAHTGISPKIALMIARYQALVGSVLNNAGGGSLAQLALLRGYFDQAHANRDFRRFTGLSPRRFQQTLNGIAKMMHQTPAAPDLSKKAQG